jgi:hypothetical protein
LCQEERASKVAKTLRYCCIRDPIAADYTIHPDVVIKVVTGDGTSDLVNVIRGRQSTDSEHPSSCKALPVEILFRKEFGEVGPKLAEEFNRVWGDEYTIVQDDNGCGQNVLVGVVAFRKPTCDGMSFKEKLKPTRSND